MPDWTIFSRGFDYDLWANKIWLRTLLGKGLPAPDTQILGHILSAQDIWLRRTYGESLAALPAIEPIEEEMDRLHAGWTSVLQAATDDRVIDFRRLNGESLSLPLSEIARHVVNHGTYHRGELRGLCRARDNEDFQDTDYARYAIELSMG